LPDELIDLTSERGEIRLDNAPDKIVCNGGVAVACAMSTRYLMTSRCIVEYRLGLFDGPQEVRVSYRPPFNQIDGHTKQVL